MIGIILGIVLIIVILLIVKKSEGCIDGGDIRDAILFGLLLTFVFNLILLFTETKVNDPIEKITTKEIIAINDMSSIDASFYLGCGNIDNENYYVYYTKTENGFKREKIDADSPYCPVYIKYISEGETPRIVKYNLIQQEVLRVEPSIWSSIFTYFDYKDYHKGDVVNETLLSSYHPFFDQDPDDFRYEILIPEGSIKEGFNIDLE